MSRIENLILDNTIHNLRQAYKKSQAPIWLATVRYLSKSSSRRPSVNIGKISRLTKEGDVVLVPGKVLGGGVISHKITVGAYSFSEKASWKIQKAGGDTLTLAEFIKKFPDGGRVILVGG
ncbi:MAG: 50S ribosomal protein L18e [archaeon]|nr:50S ribosomal protein L18e [archaeon]MCP8305956.1 50S ribosomal protein L18e [archaeon]